MLKMPIEFLEPWVALEANAEFIQRELVAEVGTGHLLYGREMRAVARREDCDDVLFVSTDEPPLVAVVHLTYARRPETDPRFPSTTIFESIEQWIERGMKSDHKDYFD